MQLREKNVRVLLAENLNSSRTEKKPVAARKSHAILEIRKEAMILERCLTF
jgi:hypothetical protein